MEMSNRLNAAARAAGVHLLGSILVAGMAAMLVFGVWYRYPYSELASGQNLFVLLVFVDVVCGPVLTSVVYNPGKRLRELIIDVGLVVLIQLIALIYGVASVAHARPVFLAFEGDRFRVVSVADIVSETLHLAPPELQELSLAGPRLIGVRLVKAGEPDYLESIQLAMAGLHPSFRPERWRHYDQVRDAVIRGVGDLQRLRARHPGSRSLIDALVERSRLSIDELGFYPVLAYRSSDWVIVVDREHGEPQGFLPVNGW